jgi:molecular chaperone DnaK
MIYPVTRKILEELTRDLVKSIHDACQRTVDEAKSKDPRFTVKDLDVVIMVGGMTRVQAVQAMVADFFKQTPRTETDPEIAVALGAAIQAGVLDGRRSGLKIKNITPHSFAIETHDKVEGVATILVPKGTPYPYKPKFQPKLANREAGQAALSIRLLQGESDQASVCTLLDSADIEIEPGDPQAVKVPVHFEIDDAGNLVFEAGDYSFGRVA